MDGRAMKRVLARMFAMACAAALSGGAQGSTRPVQRLPDRLTDAEFWRLVTDGSERGGVFPSDNFTSNEMSFPRLMLQLQARGDTGGAYIGVGPEQNFNYLLAVRPRIAFLVDIRRQSVLQHLMYKAAFELSHDRADFISLLFARPRPAGLDSTSSLFDIWERYWITPTDPEAFGPNLNRILVQLTLTHRFQLSTEDLQTLRYLYETFVRFGPRLDYSGDPRGTRVMTPPVSSVLTLVDGRVRPSRDDTLAFVADSLFRVRPAPPGVMRGAASSMIDYSLIRLPTTAVTRYYGGENFASLSMAPDDDGYLRSYLSSEANFQYVKDLQSRNLFVPLVGDFLGPTTIRFIGQYLRDHGTTLTAFYTSNVEDYVVPNPLFKDFYANVATIPVTPRSVFIRGGSSLCSIPALVTAVHAGWVTTLEDVIACRR
jgi:hypothetical protein